MPDFQRMPDDYWPDNFVLTATVFHGQSKGEISAALTPENKPNVIIERLRHACWLSKEVERLGRSKDGNA